MIPSRVRVPDMINRNIDNLPNPVAARRLIRTSLKPYHSLTNPATVLIFTDQALKLVHTSGTSVNASLSLPMRATVVICPNLAVNFVLTAGRRSGATHPRMLE